MRAMGKRSVSEKNTSSGEVFDLHKAVGDDKLIADEFDEPIVVPFRGMYRVAADDPPFRSMFAVAADDPPADSPTAEELRRDGYERQLEMLKRLGDRYGIDLNDPDGWPLLALRILSHPLIFQTNAKVCVNALF